MKRLSSVIVLLVGLVPAMVGVAPLWAANDGTGISATDTALKDFVSHLEFLGYTSEISGKILLFRKAGVPNVGLRPWQGGILLSVYVASTQGKQEQGAFGKLVNTLNETATVCRYYLDNDGDLCIEAWYPGTYVRESFSSLFKAWQDDWQRIVDKHLDDLKKYVD
jgi:hypothetical protein